MKLTPEQATWKRRYVNRLIAGGLSRRWAEKDFQTGYIENGKCLIDLTDDPESDASDELSYMADS